MEDNIVVDYISFGQSQREGYEDYDEVYTFYILEQYQNMHYGIKMLNKTFEELKKVGFDKIVVTCLFDNEMGINFYLKHGGEKWYPTYYVYEETFDDTIIVYDNDKLEKMIILANNCVLTKNS